LDRRRFLVLFIYRLLPAAFVNRALHRASYDEAGRIALRFQFHNPEGAHSLRMRGLALVLAGRYREAEDVLRRAIAKTHAGGEQAHVLDCLGNALMEMGRYDEAQRTFEAALHATPGFRRAYRGMAEILLRQHKDPQKALEYIEQMASQSRRSWWSRDINGELRDDYWAAKAWALAELGRAAEVEPAIENAARFTNMKSRPSAGAMFYRVGMAMQAIGNEKRASEYLERARDTDPDGRAGKLARAALGERSVFRN
jgi:tetratricopeptide (TPR) repeat protein